MIADFSCHHYSQLYQFAIFKPLFYFLLLHCCFTDPALSRSQTRFSHIFLLSAADIILFFLVPQILPFFSLSHRHYPFFPCPTLLSSRALPSSPTHLKLPLATLRLRRLFPGKVTVPEADLHHVKKFAWSASNLLTFPDLRKSYRLPMVAVNNKARARTDRVCRVCD